LLVYLHGFDQSGSILKVLLDSGIPMEIENGQRPPMLVISPQCPSGDNWQNPAMIERLHQLIEEIVEKYGVDPQRVYLTGFSMGGDGVWALGIAHPEQFAALAPVGSGWYNDQSVVCALKDIPVWAFQGEMDEIVSPIYVRGMVAALRQCGGQVRLTLYAGAGHLESSRLAYEEDQFYPWLLEQKR
jgi:predicted peptidase